MLLDRHLSIGKDHDICQDYTHILQPDDVNKIGIAIVCDGCSSCHKTEPTVDTGARIIALTALRYLREKVKGKTTIEQLTDNDIAQLIDVIAFEATVVAASLGISASSLSSTLLILLSDGIHSNVLMLGDGAFVYKRKGQCYMDAQQVEFTSHAPFYINYVFDKDGAQDYKDYFGTFPIYSTAYKILPDGCDEILMCKPERKQLTTNFGKQFYSQLNFMIEGELEYIAIMSDGIESFFDGMDKQPFEKMAQKMLFFKNLQGQFIQRRMLKFSSTNPELQHGDDLSITGITFTPQCKKPSIQQTETA